MSNQSNKIPKVLQLHNASTYKVENMCFTEPQLYNMGDKVTFYRVRIYTKNQDDNGNLKGTQGDLILKFPTMLCFGISENKSMNDPNVISGYSVSCCLWSKDGKTAEEDKATNLLEQIIQKCKEYLVSIRGKIRRYDLEIRDLKEMDKLLSWKIDTETGNRVEGVGPIFSPKLIEYKGKDGKASNVGTIFYDEHGNETDFRKYISGETKASKKLCDITPAIKIDNIFIGAKTINVQCKVYEADIVQRQLGSRRLLHPDSKPSSLMVSFSNDSNDAGDSDMSDFNKNDINELDL